MELEKKRAVDFFDLLGVDRNATKEAVQKAFMLKASIWHPDKASTDEEREHFTKMYEDLQVAYKVLSNDNSRRQYIDAQQTTDLEFKFADRDAGYQRSDQFQTSDGQFDAAAFQASFDHTRDQGEMSTMKQLQQSQYGQTEVVTAGDLTNLMSRRDADLEQLNSETQQVFTGTGVAFDTNTFNHAFDFMKEKSPGKGVQIYEGDPMGMFSGGGLEELDPMSSIALQNGTNFTGNDMDNLIMGQSINPDAELDLKALQGNGIYGQEQTLTNAEITQKMSAIQMDRENLATMDKSQFVVQPSEIELLYSDLFQPMSVEGLEAPQGDGAGGSTVEKPTPVTIKLKEKSGQVQDQ
jgi:hypothetical protein